MWWLLIINLWSRAEQAPYPLKPIVAASEAKCQEAGQKFIADIAADRPESLSGVTWGCTPVSDPATEKRP